MSRITYFIILLIFVNQLWALDAHFSADSLHGSLGDIIRFGWQVNHPATTELNLKEINTEESGIELLDQQLIRRESGTQLSFKTAVYDSVGPYHFPDIMVYANGQTGLDSLLLHGPDLMIYSVLTASDTTFHDIKGLHQIRTPFNLMIIVWILIIGAVSYSVYLFIKRRAAVKVQKQQQIIIPPEQAHVIALRDLERLKRSKHLHLEQFKAFYSELTHIIKQYYENRYLVDALELTTSELMHKMESMAECEHQIVDTTRELLETADLIKFAKGSSNELESGKALTRAVAIVNKTKIQNEQGVNP